SAIAATSPLGPYHLTGLGRDQAGPLVRPSVDDDQAVEADADPAEDAARPAGQSRGTPRADARGEERGADALPGPEGHRPAVERERRHPNRSGRNGVGSTAAVRPVSALATRSPVPAARPTPAPS